MVVPRHVGLIMDGNRRWATDRGLPSMEGHRAGLENLRTILQVCFESGIEIVSAYGLSIENKARRRTGEVRFLMRMLVSKGAELIDELDAQSVRFVHTGSDEGLPGDVAEVLDRGVERTRENGPKVMNLVFNYGGRQELVDAVRQIVSENPDPECISEELVQSHLYSGDLPDVDLLIRSGGESRLSNFMPWQCGRSRIHVLGAYWPAVSRNDIESAISTYAQARN